MPEEALPIPPNLSIEAGKLPHQEQASVKKWGHTFTKIAYASAAVAAVAFTVALVAAAVFFTGGAALPVFIALGAVAALSGGGALIAKFFQERLAQKESNLTENQVITSKLYEILGNELTVDDIQVASKIQDKEKLSAYLDLANRRNRGEKITDKDLQKSLGEIPLPNDNTKQRSEHLLQKITLERNPRNELPYANLIPRLQNLLGDKYDPKIARTLLYKFKDPVDQVRVSNVITALEKAKNDGDVLDMRLIGDALLDATGGSRELDNILFRIVTIHTKIDYKPLIDAIKNNRLSLCERDLLYSAANNVLQAKPEDLANIKNKFNKPELFDALLHFKARAEWDKYIAHLINSEDNLAQVTSQFLQTLGRYPVSNGNPLDFIADLADTKTPPFLTLQEIENSLSGLQEGPILLAVKNEEGKYVIKEFVVQEHSKGYTPYDALAGEYYAVKAETKDRRLVETIKLPPNTSPVVVGQAARRIDEPDKTFQELGTIELAFLARVHEFDDSNNLSDKLKEEMTRHNLPEADVKYLLDNFKTRNERNHLIRMLEYIRATKDSKGPDRTYNIIQATTPFFNMLLKAKNYDRDPNALKIISRLLTPEGENIPYRYGDVLAIIPRLGLQPGDHIPLIKSGDLGEPRLIDQIYQGDKEPRFANGENEVSPSGAHVSEYLFAHAEPFDAKNVKSGKSQLVNNIGRTMINKDLDDPNLKSLGNTYQLKNKKGENVEVRVQHQFEKEINRFQSISINGKTFNTKEELIQSLFTACNDDPEIMLNLSPFLSQAAIASGAVLLDKIKDENTIAKQKRIALSIDSTDDAIKVTLETAYAITGNPERILLSEFATSKVTTLYKEELKAGNAERSSGTERLFMLPKSDRLKDTELILSKLKENEKQGFIEDLGELEIYFLESINLGRNDYKKLNGILQPLLRKLDQSKMSRADKLVVLAAIHRLASRNAQTVPIPYEEALKYNKDPSQIYTIEISINRVLVLKKGSNNVLKQYQSTNPIITQDIIDKAGVEFEKANSTSEINVGLNPIEINNHFESVELQTNADYKVGNAENAQTLQVNPSFVKDLHRSLFIINGQMLTGEAAADRLNQLVNDPVALRHLAMLLNQSVMALPKTFTTSKFVELVEKGELGSPINSGPVFVVEINGDEIKIRAFEENVYVDKDHNAVKNEMSSVEFILNKQMFHTHDYSKASYVVRQRNVPLENFEFLGDEFKNEIPILKNNLYPLSIAWLKDYLEFKKGIGNNPSDEQLALLLEMQTELLMTLNDNKTPELLNALKKITAFPDISNRWPAVVKHYKKDIIRIFDIDYLNVPSNAQFKVNKNDPEHPITFIDSLSEAPTAEWMKDSFNLSEQLPATVINTQIHSPKNVSKTSIELSDGQKIAYPEISRIYLEKAKFMIKNKEVDGKAAANELHQLLGNDAKKTEFVMQLVTAEQEKSLLFKAQQWVNVNHGTSYKVTNPQVLHRIEMIDGKPVYTLEILAEANIDGEIVRFNMMRIISLDEEDVNNGIGNKSFIQDKITVAK